MLGEHRDDYIGDIVITGENKNNNRLCVRWLVGILYVTTSEMSSTESNRTMLTSDNLQQAS